MIVWFLTFISAILFTFMPYTLYQVEKNYMANFPLIINNSLSRL
jgi:hypothetical protein